MLFANLRGLGIANKMEFILMLGVSINICDLILRHHKKFDPRLSCMLETAKLITVCLLISSDQQVLQALSVKNDFVIALYFAISCLTALIFLRSSDRLRLSGLLGSGLILIVYAYTSKSYGILCVVPFVVLAVLRFREIRNTITTYFASSGGHRRATSFSWDATCLLYVLSASLIVFSIAFNSFAKEGYSNLAEYQSSVTILLNRYSDPFSYAKAAFLNFLRFLLSFASYPYSTWLKPQATSPDDFWLGLSPLVKLLSSNDFAIADGYAFRLIRYRSEDASLTSPLLQLAALIALVTLAYCVIFFNGRSTIQGTYLASLRRVIDIQGIMLILISSVASSFLVFAVLSYHNWYVKYMGFSYICLIPVVSWLLVFNLAEIFASFGITLERLANSSSIQALKLLLMFFALAFLAWYLSLSSHYFSLKLASKDVSAYKLYEEYLFSKGLTSPESKNQFFSQFSGKRENGINLCFGEETPSLAPLLELSKQNPDPGSVGLYPLGAKSCSMSRSAPTDRKTIILP
jgi:hypothetical protein